MKREEFDALVEQKIVKAINGICDKVTTEKPQDEGKDPYALAIARSSSATLQAAVRIVFSALEEAGVLRLEP